MLKRLFLILACAGLVTSCTPPVYTVKKTTEPPRPLPSVELYYYPTKGQTPAQQDRDRYECYLWAKEQSGFDPGQAQAPHQRVEVRPAQPGSDVAGGAVGGAIVGSMLAMPGDRRAGMVFGAITGAILGASSEAAKQQQAERIEQQYNARDAQTYSRLERQARDYRRAMTACLEGRGYTVK
jgi:hypothetical protein